MRALKKGAVIIDKLALRIACIDDFAFRKGQRYGTVLINVETRKVVDILNSRDFDDVKRWLDEFPNLQIVSRDGSITYRKAISAANENIIQLSDRFHLIKNLTEYAKGYLKRTLPAYVLVEDMSRPQVEHQDLPRLREKYRYANKWELILAVQKMRSDGFTQNQIAAVFRLGNRTVATYARVLPEEQAKYEAIPIIKSSIAENESVRASKIRTIQEMKAEGYTKMKIADALGISERTVRRMLNADPSGKHGRTGSKRESKLDPYKEEILEMSAKGQSSLKIWKNLQARGYTGGSAIIRDFLQKYHIEATTDPTTKSKTQIRIDRQSLIALLYRDRALIKDLREDHYHHILNYYPEMARVLQLLKEFKAILLGKNSHLLQSWKQSLAELNIPELNSFLVGVEKDEEAIRNAIIFPYSNGLAEGTVNKIKVIKRIMFGRCGFEMLRKKILLNNIN